MLTDVVPWQAAVHAEPAAEFATALAEYRPEDAAQALERLSALA